MRFITLLLIVALITLGFTGVAQRISFSVKNASLIKVFNLIEVQAGVKFFYRVELLKKSQKVTLTLRNASLKDALDLCFKKQPLIFQIIDRIVVVKEKPTVNSSQDNTLKYPVSTSSIKVTGRIVTTEGEPVEMANVTIKGKKKGCYSNANGEFFINVDDENSVLVVSSIAIEPTEVEIENKTNITVIVNGKISSLDSVQIIGYGQTTKRLNTGNVTTITSKDIEKQPVNNILAALEGRVPGLVITQETGLTGGAFDLLIRGNGSLTSGGDPLVLVDGIPFPLDQYHIPIIGNNYFFKFNNTSAKSGGNPLNLINTADIERVDILKDADATAIYGSRGGNGVILITTKKGKPGKPAISLNAYTGLGVLTRLPKMLNGQQYLEMRREAKRNDNASITALDVDINGKWDTARYTNWSKELLGGKAAIADVQLSLSGGTSQMSYLLNGTYHRETSVMSTNGADRNYALYFSASNASKNKKLQTALSAGYLSKTDDLPPVDFTGNLKFYIPNQPASYLPNDSLNYDKQIVNPYKELKKLYEMNATNLFSNLKVSYKPVTGLELSASVGFNRQHQHDFLGVPTLAQSPGVKSYAKYSSNQLSTFIIEPQAQYAIAVNGKTKLSALIGSTYQNSTTTYKVTSANDFSNDAQLRQPELAATVKAGSSYKNYRYLGSFSRLSYNRSNKYLLNLTGRIDGTSRFGTRKQFQPFGAVGLAWIFSDEGFMKNLQWVNTAKLRGSYGVVGNSDIPDYLFSPAYVPVNGPYQGITGIDPVYPDNPELGWERKKSWEMALELQLFNKRLDFTVSLYRQLNTTQLKFTPLSAVTGFAAVYENGKTVVENKGLELTLVYTAFRGPNFSWNVSANATLPKNNLRKFDGIESSPYNEVFTVGQPITSVKVYRRGGVDPQTGNYFFLDKAGKPTASLTAEDKTGLVNTAPTFYGSVINSINCKAFSLDVHCMFIFRTGRTAFAESSNLPGTMQNQAIEVLSRWQQPGDRTNVAKYTQVYSTSFVQTYQNDFDSQYSNASFLRVKNISLSYKVNTTASQRMHIKNLRCFFQAQNVFTISPYKNLDPETTYFEHGLIVARMPLLRTFTAGLQATF